MVVAAIGFIYLMPFHWSVCVDLVVKHCVWLQKYQFCFSYLRPLDETWVGAWWLGFVIFGNLCTVVAIPILFLPAQLPGLQFIFIDIKFFSCRSLSENINSNTNKGLSNLYLLKSKATYSKMLKVLNIGE